MIDVTDLRAGTTFQIEGTPYVVVKYTHTKLGRGGATVRVEVRNLKTGRVEEKTFNSGTRVEEAPTTKRRLQYLYKDEENAVFMDPQSFEQVEIPRRIAGGEIRFVKDGQEADVLFWSSGDAVDVPLTIELPPKVTLKVTDTSPGVKGNSATNIWKPAVLESGLQIKVPLFINVGDAVRVDTRTGEYIERAK
ncbi:elongation factor P [Candidatus Microgenomates bacterium]|nr:elongation factor P [Candidatus Microgenomates bacterium]